MIYTSKYQSPLGEMTMASDGEALIGLWFDGQKYFEATLRGEYHQPGEVSFFENTRRWLDMYFSGDIPDFTPKINLLHCSDFRRMVCDIMLTIPYGHTTTYGEISKEVARRMGRKTMSSRAIGAAVGHNPISVIIPCHRVLGANGSLTGYAGGIERKIALLNSEKR